MEGIIFLVGLAILVVPIVLFIWLKVSISGSIKEVLFKVNTLSSKLDLLKENSVLPKVVTKEEDKSIDERVERLMNILPKKEEKVVKKVTPVAEVKPQPKVVKPIAPKVVQPKPIQKAAFVKPVKKRRDWEKFIGENLMNKIGIGILVLGIAYFVKFAIDKHWINEVGRVAIGILSGGLLAFVAHKIRKTYKAFSAVLIGGAMAVFYYTISIGFHDYQLFSQPVAFALMVVITGFSVLLAVSYDKKELAILAIVGAFTTPLMLSTGSGDYRILFTYIAIVNIGMLVLAYFKKWNVVNILSLSFTVVLYAWWFIATIVKGINPPYSGALFFATLYYVIFFLMHVLNNVKEKRAFKGYEFGLLLGTTALYYSVGMVVLYLSGNTNYQGLFTVLLGVFNLGFAYPLFKQNRVDKTFIFLLVGMVLSFASLAAPVQLSGSHITLFWATEMVLLLWLGQKANIQFIKLSSLIIFGLTIVSLLMDWQQTYFEYSIEPLAIVLNKGFITALFVTLAAGTYLKLLSKESGDYFIKQFSLSFMNGVVKMVFAGLVYFMVVFELSTQISSRLGNDSLAVLSVLSYSLIYLLGLIKYSSYAGLASLQKVLGLSTLILLFLFPMFNGFVQGLRNGVLYGNTNALFFILNYINVSLIALLAIRFIKNSKEWYGLNSMNGKAVVWFVSIIGLIVLSMELHHITNLLFFDVQLQNMNFINKQTVKIGYPIVWGLSSFVLMLVGMKYKFRTLRIISLTIFSAVLLKLFMFDIKGASEGGKIVAFILLGVLLLVISFMYQKLKNLILEDTPINENKNPEE